MWPVLLDMTKEESMQSLRNLELEAYAHLVSALRAQGPLSPDKRKLLKETGQILNIPQDRHKAEIRRAVNDERLNTISYHATGFEYLEEWAQEGRRSVPLIPRMAPQTAYSAIADEAAESANQTNKVLPHPASTEQKRPQTVQVIPESSKISFRVPDAPKSEENKKRKFSVSENSSLTQHLLGPSKVSRAQQMYRQRMRVTPLKETVKLRNQTKVLLSPIVQSTNGPKMTEETIELVQNEINSYSLQKSDTSMSNENQAPRKVLTSSKPSVTFKQVSAPGPSEQKTVKVCPKKAVAKPGTPLTQKLIVVSNAQTIPNSGILQKTLSIPVVKNISVKNLEKFKIVTSAPQMMSGVNNINSLKHKVVTVKTNPNTAKKVIPLSLINSKGGIKVLPIGGKIIGKTTTTATSQPLYIVNTMCAKVAPSVASPITPSSPSKENGKSSVLGDIMKASGMTTDDFDTQIEEFRIPNNHVTETEVQQQIEEKTCAHGKEEFVVLQTEEMIENSKDEETKEEHLNVKTDSETVVLQVTNSELTSVSEASGN